MAGVSLGVGRDTAADPVESLAGIELLKKIGEPVSPGEVVMRLWAEEKERIDAGESRLEGSFSISDNPPAKRESLIIEEITG